MDRYLLEYEIKCRGMTIQEVCKHIGMSPSTYYKKVRGVSEFTQSEIQKLIDLLEIDDPTPIFFSPKVS